MKFDDFPRTIQNMYFFKLVLFVAILLTVILFIFIDPRSLDASDFMLVAWNPGKSLLQTGSVYADYPYPLWTVVVMLPFTIWSPTVSMLLWFICNLFMLAASLVLLIRLFEWNMSPIFFVTIVLISGYFLPVLTSLWLGQLTIFSLLILLLTAYMFKAQRWGWLGIMLGLSFIKPQVMILVAGLLLLWALWQRRWKILLGFGAVIIFLTLISLPFITSPGQIIGGGISSHLATYIQKTSTLWGLFLNLGTSWLIPLMISLALMAWLGLIWLPFLRGKEMSSKRMLFLFSAATLVNLMAIPYSWMHNLTLLLLPLGYSLSLALKIKSSARFIWLTLLFVIMHPLMFGLFVAFSKFDHKQAYQIISALALLPIMIFLESQTTSERS